METARKLHGKFMDNSGCFLGKWFIGISVEKTSNKPAGQKNNHGNFMENAWKLDATSWKLSWKLHVGSLREFHGKTQQTQVHGNFMEHSGFFLPKCLWQIHRRFIRKNQKQPSRSRKQQPWKLHGKCMDAGCKSWKLSWKTHVGSS